MPVRDGLLLCESRRSNCLPESIATGPALLRAVAFATLSRFARGNPPSAVLILFYSGEKKPVFADRFLKYGRRERITRPCGTRPSGRCVRNVVSLRSAQPSFGGAHPLLFRRKKTCLCRQVSKYGRRERMTRPCGTRPSGRCVRNVVSLRSGQPSFGGAHPILFRRKKTCLCRQVS
ncbi:hypothetical protein NB701_003143 [Pantoea ananatis]|nr:hypothetical protein [Pantoea ananatis]